MRPLCLDFFFFLYIYFLPICGHPIAFVLTVGLCLPTCGNDLFSLSTVITGCQPCFYWSWWLISLFDMMASWWLDWHSRTRRHKMRAGNHARGCRRSGGVGGGVGGALQCVARAQPRWQTNQVACPLEWANQRGLHASVTTRSRTLWIICVYNIARNYPRIRSCVRGI